MAKAAHGLETLQILEKHGADAIISDILMPRMDGYRLCREVRKREPFKNLPFLMDTSTYVSPSDKKLSLDLGADVFMRKPAPAPSRSSKRCAMSRPRTERSGRRRPSRFPNPT